MIQEALVLALTSTEARRQGIMAGLSGMHVACRRDPMSFVGRVDSPECKVTSYNDILEASNGSYVVQRFERQQTSQRVAA